MKKIIQTVLQQVYVDNSGNIRDKFSVEYQLQVTTNMRKVTRTEISHKDALLMLKNSAVKNITVITRSRQLITTYSI